MITLTWVLGVVGFLGLGGTIAAFIFFPAIAVPIVEKITAAVLGCKTCLLVAAAVALSLGSFWYGYVGEYEKGYHAALIAIASEDAKAIQAATEKRAVWKECRARNGEWDQSKGECK